MKKIVALLLALVMVLSLGACSVEKTPETQAPETQPAATEGTQAAAPEAAGDPVEISVDLPHRQVDRRGYRLRSAG